MRKRILMSAYPEGKIVTETMLNGCVPMFSQVVHEDWESEESEIFLGDTICDTMSDVDAKFKRSINQDLLLRSICISADNKDFIPLSKQFDFKAGESFNSYQRNQELLNSGVEEGTTLWDILNDENYKKLLTKTANNMFYGVNPLTQKSDLSGVAHPEYVPLVISSGSMYPQYNNGLAYFNPEGTVTVAEFLDSLVAIKVGKTKGTNVKKSLDGMSDRGDYYNEGYNNLLSKLSSPFYRLYTREDLTKPITRFELAYLTVVCWDEFTSKFDPLYSGRYDLGINVNWGSPQKYIHKFTDGKDYKVSKKSFNTEYGKITNINVQDYFGECADMTEFKEDIRDGVKAIPLPMFMSLFELHALDLFPFDEGKLQPLKEVSREELCTFLIRLAKEFSSKFISYGDITE